MKHQRGAALLVVMMIVGLIGAMFAIQNFTGTAAQRDHVTANMLALAQAREALIGFALVKGRLPCPAPANAVSGTALAGLEPSTVLSAGCTNLAGVLPWVTLGINETDAWGNRFTYRVTKKFTLKVPLSSSPKICPPTSNPAKAAFALCSQGDMTVRNTGGGATLASTVPALLISHGKNGNGAYTTQGKQLPVGADADELENQLTGSGSTTADTTFIDKTSITNFDDSVTWLSSAVLIAQMQKAGLL